MGRLTWQEGDVIYLDTNLFIYYIEAIPPFGELLRPVFEALQNGKIKLKTSKLAILEVLVKPIGDGNSDLVSRYKDFLLDTEGVYLVPISLEILEQAAYIRARYKVKTPDAIHAATALSVGCNSFLTNDPQFKRIGNLNTEVLSEVAEQK